ncbi:hypothetical protein SBOR_9239 [Sclerotinia borealis F-4128]|uniref:Uncharacterized protein n=1 Tax=Sclerotinia borealis (strain F-4128) TaxID=1432307 RepID=W9C0R1_SCLBF|nr:hypothetical protein SBOR_9239 [Sclerotinia borealis F-4128]
MSQYSSTKSPPIKEDTESSSREFGYVYEMAIPKHLAEWENRKGYMCKRVSEELICATAKDCNLPRWAVTVETVKYRGFLNESDNLTEAEIRDEIKTWTRINILRANAERKERQKTSSATS